MNYYLRLLFTTLIFLLLINDTKLIVVAEQAPESVLISDFEDDLTGDGQKEIMLLKGLLLSQERNYYQNIWVEITSKHSERWRIPFRGGYEPKIYLFDLNHDNIRDLFYQVTTNETDKINTHYLYTLKNGSINEIPLPKQPYIKGQFINDFHVEIHLSVKDNNKPVFIDVEDQVQKYIKLGLYNKQGKLLNPRAVIINPISSYEPTLISKSKGYGLKSYQQISGAYRDDKLGIVETLWYYENGDWMILQNKWIPF